MANYTTNADIIDDVLDRAGEPTDNTSDYQSQAVRLVNRAYHALWSGGGEFEPSINESWWWLRKEGQITLQPKIDGGTVDVTNNSTSITFSSSITTDITGYHFKVDSHDDVFTIASHGGNSKSATLDSVYTGSSDSSANYKAFKIDYNLASDVLSLINPMQAHGTYHRIYMMGLDLMHRDYPVSSIESGTPSRFAMLGERKVRFNRYGGRDSTEDGDGTDDLIRIDYDYLYEPSDIADDANSPAVPRQYRHVLADMALMWLLQMKNDDRADGVGQSARAGIRAMARENRHRWSSQADLGVIYPRNPANPHGSRVPRTESGLIIGGP